MKKKEYDKKVLDVMNKKLTAKQKMELSKHIAAYKQNLEKEKKKGGFRNTLLNLFFRILRVR